MAPMNPCKMLEEIYQRAVFFKVVNKPFTLDPKETIGLSADATD